MLNAEREAAVEATAGRIGASVALLGGVTLVGWSLDLFAADAVPPGLAVMRPSTAACFLGLGVAIALRVRQKTLASSVAANSIAVAVGLVGLGGIVGCAVDALSVGERAHGFDARAADAATSSAMSLATSCVFVWLSSALALRSRAPRVSSALASAAAVVGLCGAAGYAFGVRSLYAPGGLNAMSLPTALATLLTAGAVVAYRVRHGVFSVVLSDASGGIVARRLLPAIPASVLCLGVVAQVLVRVGAFDDRAALAMLSVFAATGAGALTLRMAHLLRSLDVRRLAAEAELAAAAEGLAQEVEVRRRAELAAQEASVTDSLTGLLNRRGFALVATRFLAERRRDGRPATVVFADVDGLKRVNDEEGHAAGDALIRAAADRLAAVFRESDVVARMGGDEFAILLSGADAPETLVERVATAGGDDGRRAPSLSVGVWRGEVGPETTIDGLLSAADARMYAAKRARKRARGETATQAISIRAADGSAPAPLAGRSRSETPA
ncbi:MAG: GGDEF domain-containing protein [Myxococcales bacterium]|nr:GGDEF domain-containing protein [Myxococcales bacterium]MCB9530222.1 GGDEF domain-containing protein [Myxococcales bacterium]MCB9533735.1 GGDEF domain-containing protein [Myxococcales bacterium]